MIRLADPNATRETIMLLRPRLRAVEVFPVQQEGKTLVYLKDPENFAQPLGISPAGYFILSHFDGEHSLVDIQEAYCKQFGTLLLSDELQRFIDLLDHHYYLQSARFLVHRNGVVEEFKKQPTRLAAHAGSVYRQDRRRTKDAARRLFLVAERSRIASCSILEPRVPGRLLRRTSTFIAAGLPTLGLTRD